MSEYLSSPAEFSVELLSAGEEAMWGQALKDSTNATIFHDLGFLAYHPSARFEFHHLVVRRGSKVVSLVPGGVVLRSSGSWLVSPQGGSVGGPTFRARMPVEELIGVVSSIQAYTRQAGFSGVSVTIPPSPYSSPTTDVLSYALAATGFELEERLYCHFLELPSTENHSLHYSKSRRYEIKRGVASGLMAGERDARDLGSFFEILLANFERFGADPTHSEEEMTDLFSRFQGRARLFLCSNESEDIAGIVLFQVTDSVANTFYICERPSYRGQGGTSVLLAHVTKVAADEGFRFLDLGPSTHSGYVLNPGVARFKESFGATGFCRDTWSWQTQDIG